MFLPVMLWVVLAMSFGMGLKICTACSIIYTAKAFFQSVRNEYRSVRQRRIPQSETLQVLPFWMPLFYLITSSALLYQDWHFDNLLLETLKVIGSVCFPEWQVIAEMSRDWLGRSWSVLLAPVPHCLAALVFALTAAYWVPRMASRPFPAQGQRRMIRVTLLLCFIALAAFLTSPY